VVQVHPDSVADLELSIVWLLLAWHAMEYTPDGDYSQFGHAILMGTKENLSR
jgi:hypothetical protein